MNATTIIREQTVTAEAASTEPHLQEQFVAQVDDRSLPAQQVLTEQKQAQSAHALPAVYVP